MGKRRFEAALAKFPQRDQVQVVWRSFELDPSTPRELPPGDGYAQRLADKYGMPLQQAKGMFQRVVDAGKPEGIDFRFDRIIGANTFDAHRLLHFAKAKSLEHQNALKDRLVRAHFTDGLSVSHHDVLARLAAEVGLDETEAKAVLASDRYSDDVRADQSEAQSLGIRGVPMFVLGRRYGVSGAQPADLFLRALEQAFAEPELLEVAPAAPTDAPAPDACGPEGCEVPTQPRS